MFRLVTSKCLHHQRRNLAPLLSLALGQRSDAVAAVARAQYPVVLARAFSSLPPNLKIDSRSSFARQPSSAVVYEEDIQVDDDETGVADASAEMKRDSDNKEVNDDYVEIPSSEDEVRYVVPLPDRLHVPVYTFFAPMHSNHVGTLWLEESVFGMEPIRVDLIKRAVDYIRAKKRGRRKAVTKTISQVSGSGRKVRPQKGQGRARAGHSRPPHWRGGAKAHGPKNVTDYGNIKLNRKVRKLALRHVLSQKLLEGNLILLNQMHELPTPKTGELAKLLNPWDIAGRHGTTALLLDHYRHSSKDNDQAAKAISYRYVPVNLHVASANMHKLTVGNDRAANVYDILRHEKLILTLSALEQIEGRLKED